MSEHAHIQHACILVVDDDAHLRRATTRVLNQAGCQVTEAETGAQGLRLANAQRPDLILLDMKLPDMDGLDLCRRVKGAPALSGCFVVVLGDAEMSPDDRATGLEAGADGYIVRPISDRELLARVEALLRIKAAEERVTHLNQVLRAMRNINQLLVREKDRDRMLRGACELLVETRGYHNAWLALFEEPGGPVTTAQAGADVDFFSPILEQLNRGALTACGRQALAQGEAVVTEDPPATCADCPLAESYAGRGAITVRVEHDGQVYGLLMISIPAQFTVDREERDLLQEVAEDIAFALYNIRLEEALLESEERYRSLFEEMPVGLYRTAPDGEIIDANPALVQMLGYPDRASYLATDAADLYIDPEDRERALQALEDADGWKSVQLKLRRRDGRVIWVLDSARAIKDDQGRTRYYIGALEDITAQVHAEEKLGRSESKYRKLIETMPYGVEEVDIEGRRVFLNDSYHQMLGYQPGELLGTYIWDHDPSPQQVERLKRYFERLKEEQPAPEPYVSQNVRKDGAIIDVLVDWDYERDENGALEGFISVVTDITARMRAEEALRASEEKYRSLVEQSIQGMVVAQDNPVRLRFASRPMQAITGFSPQELTSFGPEQLASLIHPEDREAFFENFRARLAGQAVPPRHEYRVIHKNGGTRWVEIYSASIEYEGAPATQTVFLDISERKQAEEALREATLRQREAVKAGNVGLWDWDLVTDKVRYSAEWKRQIGYQKHEIGDDFEEWRSRIHPDDLETILEQVRRSIAERRQDHQVEFRFRHKDGSYRWILAQASVLQDETGRPVRMVGSHVDITERKRAEEERARLASQVREQAREMAHILATVPAGVLLLDAEGRVLQANPTAQGDLAALARANVGDVLTRLGNRPLAALLAPPPKGLWHEVRAGGRIFEAIARPVENGPQPEHWVLVINDVTREREIRAQFQQQERLAAVGQLAAGIAHDFNNIMAAITLYAQMAARSESLPQRDRERMAVIDQQARHATRLIQQILDFSRRATLERQPLDLLPLLKEQVKLLKRTLPEHIGIELEYGQDEHTVNADPTRLQQMLTNLAVNARDAMLDGGTLRIGLQRVAVEDGQAPHLPEIEAGDWIRLTVSDTGTGIPADVVPHIFEPFFTTKGPGEGSGLGLAQVHGIVGQHGGRVDVASQVGEGTTFAIYLPALAVRPAESPPPDVAAAPRGRGEMVLVVEDEDAVRTALVASLEQLNYRTLEAANGEEALAVLERQGERVALVLSDVVMPGMGGMALFRTLRERGCRTPVILLTGHPIKKDLDELWAQGLSAWLTKPPHIEHLAQAVADALRE